MFPFYYIVFQFYHIVFPWLKPRAMFETEQYQQSYHFERRETQAIATLEMTTFAPDPKIGYSIKPKNPQSL